MSCGNVQLNKPAPDFTKDGVQDGKFTTIKLSDFKGKWVVLFFYPLDFTFVCPTEILAFDAAASEFEKIGCHLVGASCDSKFSHLAWTKASRKDGGLGGLTIPLISDFDKSMAKDYGVLVPDGDDAGVTYRGSFLIDPKGNVRQITINDLPVGRSVEEQLRLVKAFQFTDENGEVCPANWKKKGDPTIKTDPKDSLEYFSSVNK
eukprot:gene5051-8646_t